MENWKEKLYEEKPFLTPNGGDIKSVKITYEDWLWLERFISKVESEAFKRGVEAVKLEKKSLLLVKSTQAKYAIKGYNQAISDLENIKKDLLK